MHETLELFDLCAVRAPRKALPEDGALRVHLTQANKISRVALEFHKSQVLSANGLLQFDADYSRIPELEYDIARGDACFPEIHIAAADGEHFRFKRGNFKDFFALSRRDEVQQVALPLAAFLHNIDMASNTPPSGTFFDKPIRQISFDFLRPHDGEAEVVLRHPQLVRADAPPLSVFSCLDMLPHVRPTDDPLMTTSAGKLNMRVSRTDVGLDLCPPGTALHVAVSQNGTRTEKVWPLGEGNTYLEMGLPRRGVADVSLRLEAAGRVIARSPARAVRTVPAQPVSNSGMGWSDGANYHMAAKQGGQFLRLVVGFNQIRFDEETGFFFAPGSSTLDTMRALDRPWFISFKAMPPCLRQDVPDGYRRGPRDMGLYAQMMHWLIPQLQDAGAEVFESWNEANVIHEWTGTPEDLAAMHAATRAAVAASGRGGKVLTPSSTTWDFDYFDQVLTSPMAANSDGLAFHGYTYAPDRAGALFDRLEARIADSATPDLPAYLTEVGFRTPALSEEVQAVSLALFSLHCFFRPRFRAIAWFRFQNENPETLSGYNQNASSGYGMVGYRGRYARPGLAAFRFMDRLLSGTTPGAIETRGDQTLFHGAYGGAALTCVHGAGAAPAARFCHDIYGNAIASDAEAPLRIFSDAPLDLG